MKDISFNIMKKGWFVGDFLPTAYKTRKCEVAYKCYKWGDYESSHHHKIATEITFIVKGVVMMNGKIWREGTILVIEPGESTDFEAITDVETIVVKVPGAENDKYED